MKRGLSRRVSLMCMFMAVMICLGTGVCGYYMIRNSIRETYKITAYNLADTASFFVDGNTVAEYLDGREPDEKYEEMSLVLSFFADMNDLSAIYLCTVDEATLTLTTIYDTRVEDAAQPWMYARGVIDAIGTKDPRAPIRIFQSGERIDDDFIRKTDFGYNISAIVPIKNDAGDTTALMVLDKSVPELITYVRRFLVSMLIVTALIVLGLTLAYVVLMRKKIIEPIERITAAASSFAETKEPMQESMVARTHDEIEILALTMIQMERDINASMDTLARVTAERERIAAELDVAEKIQSDMLPRIFPPYPNCPQFSIYATMTPAKEVGGDFYDFFCIDQDHFGLVMADVSGKGIPAALFMVISKTLIKNSAQPGCSPREVMEAVNRQLCENNEAAMFVTVWFGILEISTGNITAVNAGHEKPLVMKKGGEFAYLRDKHGMMLAALDMVRYKEYEIQLEPGDRLFLYTDGLLEATNSGNELYGEERALQSLNEHKGETIYDLLEHVHSDTNAFVGEAPQFDDLTMMVLEYHGNDAG